MQNLAFIFFTSDTFNFKLEGKGKEEEKNKENVSQNYLELSKVASDFLGADCKNSQTTKQLNNFIWTNRKVETKLHLLHIGPNKKFNCLVV